MSVNIREREINPAPGFLMLFVNIFGMIGCLIVFGCCVMGFFGYATPVVVFLTIAMFVMFCIFFGGLKTVKPNEAMVLTLFGKYHGTVKKAGFFFINPFAQAFNPARSVVMNAQG